MKLNVVVLQGINDHEITDFVGLAAELRLGFSGRETEADVASFGRPEKSEMREALALCKDRHDQEAE